MTIEQGFFAPNLDEETYRLLGVENPREAESQQLEVVFDRFVDLAVDELEEADELYADIVVASAEKLGLPVTYSENKLRSVVVIEVSPAKTIKRIIQKKR